MNKRKKYIVQANGERFPVKLVWSSKNDNAWISIKGKWIRIGAEKTMENLISLFKRTIRDKYPNAIIREGWESWER